MTDKEIYQRQAARDILSMIEEVCFSKNFIKFRVNLAVTGKEIILLTILKGSI